MFACDLRLHPSVLNLMPKARERFQPASSDPTRASPNYWCLTLQRTAALFNPHELSKRVQGEDFVLPKQGALLVRVNPKPQRTASRSKTPRAEFGSRVCRRRAVGEGSDQVQLESCESRARSDA